MSELTEAERLELARLRAEKQRLKMECEILRKAQAFRENRKPGGSGSSNSTTEEGR